MRLLNFKTSAYPIFIVLIGVSFNSLAQQGIGIDVANPLEKLDVDGAIKMGTTANVPPGGAGTMRWNGTNFEGWDGTQWVTFGIGSDGDWTFSGNNLLYDIAGTGGAEIIIGADGASHANTSLRVGNAVMLRSNGNSYYNGGNLGVGLLTPAEKLHVVGSIRMVDGNQQTGRIPVADANGTMVWTDPATITTAADGDWTINGNDMYNGNSGNVGVGTNTPQAPLHVQENSSTGQILVTPEAPSGQDASVVIRGARNGSTSTNPSQLRFQNYDDDISSSNTMGVIASRVTNATTNVGDLLFLNSTDGTTLSETMRLTKDGNVGIGTSAPADELHVAGSIRMVDGNQLAGRILVSDANGTMTWTDPSTITTGDDGDWTVSGLNVFNTTSNIGIGTNTPNAKLHVELTNGDFKLFNNGAFNGTVLLGRLQGANGLWPQFRINGNGSLDIGADASGNFVIERNDVARVTIDETGKVGVGTSTPDRKLHIKEGEVEISSSTGAPAIYFEDDTDNSKMSINYQRSFDRLEVRDNSNAVKFVVENASGHVGIGVENPNQQLHVVGSIRMVDGNEAAGKVMVSDANGTASWSNAPSINVLHDADNDTKVQVEESADEDIIRFDVAGAQQWQMQENRLENTDNSLYVGDDAGLADNAGSGSFNTAIGNNALRSNTANGSTAVGFDALRNADAGGNTGVGKGALYTTTSGNLNTAIGQDAGYQNSTGAENVFIGQNAMSTNATGSNNVAIGRNAGRNGGSRSGNIYIGHSAGHGASGDNKLYIENSNSSSPLIYGEFDNDIVAVNGSLGVGTQSPSSALHVLPTSAAGPTATLETGANPYPGAAVKILPSTHATSERASVQLDDWHIIQDRTGNGTKDFTIWQQSSGQHRLTVNTSGNVGIGDQTPDAKLDIEGSIQMVDGNQAAGKVMVSDANGTASWSNAPSINVLQDDDGDTKIQVEESADEDIIRFDLGGTEYFAMQDGRIEVSNTGNSVFIGPEAGDGSGLNDRDAVYIGYQAGKGNTGWRNIGIGYLSMSTAGSGSGFNAAVGTYSMQKLTTGEYNIAMGHTSLREITTGESNTGLGMDAGREITTGNNNTAVGRAALKNTTTGEKNVAIGFWAGSSTTTGTGNVFIGSNSGLGNPSNRLFIDNHGTAFPLIYGEFDNHLVRINGTLNINNAFSFPAADGTSGYLLTTNGAGTVSWTDPATLSDGDWEVSGNDLIYTIVGTGGAEAQVIADGSDFANTHFKVGSNVLLRSNGNSYLNGGNVGIGIITPSNLLDIADGTRTGTHPTGLRLYVTGGMTANSDGVEFRHSNGTQGIGFGFNTIYAAGSQTNQNLSIAPKGTGLVIVAGPSRFQGILNTTNNWVSGDGDAEGIYVDDDGQVGIGENNPTAKLEVKDGGIRITHSSSSPSITFEDADDNSKMSIHYNRSSDRLDFRDNSGTNVMVIENSDGDVGIGTNNPRYNVHVHETTSAESLTLYTNSTTGSTINDGFFVGLVSSEEAKIKHQENEDLIFGTNDVDRVWIKNDGDVGVGTSSPDWLFHVKDDQHGSSNFIAEIENTDNDNSANSEGLLIVAGHNSYNSSNKSNLIRFNRPDGTNLGRIRQDGGSSVELVTASDKRLKENIAPTVYGLAEVMNMEVKDYNYIGDKATDVHTGFLAQDLLNVFPYVVDVGGADAKTDPWGVAYGKLTPIMVKAIQDLAHQKNALETQVNEQSVRIQQLLERVQALEQE